jgi:hypothetical protein
MIKVIKKNESYQRMIDSLKSPDDLSFQDDKGVAEFRAFYPVANLHASTVSNPQALDTMLEVVTTLQNSLQNRRKMITLQ